MKQEIEFDFEKFRKELDSVNGNNEYSKGMPCLIF